MVSKYLIRVDLLINGLVSPLTNHLHPVGPTPSFKLRQVVACDCALEHLEAVDALEMSQVMVSMVVSGSRKRWDR